MTKPSRVFTEASTKMLASNKNFQDIVQLRKSVLFGELKRLSRSLKIVRKVYDNCSHIFLSRTITKSRRDTRDFYLPGTSRVVRAPHDEFLVLSRYQKRPEYNAAIKFFVIEFIFAQFIADASDSRLSLAE